jgi:2-isopropylmalate synthase
MVASQAPAVAIVGKTWPLHIEAVMGNTRTENLAMIRDSVSHLKQLGREVIYDAEHFFDAYAEDSAYALETLLTAFNSGADVLVLCDTNGGSLPFAVEQAVADVIAYFREHHQAVPRIGIHAHNDCGLAVANSITAVRAGATMVQGTVNGYGERCGNADLTSIIPILNLKMGRVSIPADKLKRLKSLSRFVSETANMIPLNSRPFVGKSAFAHKGGLHVNAIMKVPRAYEHIDPTLVGNERRVLVSDLGGKSNVVYKARELGVELGDGSDNQKIISQIKELESQGYQYDVADGSMKILLQKMTEQFKPLFDLESFRVTIEKDKDQPCSAHATIKIAVNGAHEITAAEGQGPVSALDNALRKALGKFYPTDLNSMQLVDFKVRVIDGRDGTAAKVRVFIESRDHEEIWSTIGVSEDIIEASWQALADSFQFKLAKLT